MVSEVLGVSCVSAANHRIASIIDNCRSSQRSLTLTKRARLAELLYLVVRLLDVWTLLEPFMVCQIDISMILVLVWTTIVVAGSERFGAILAHGIVPQWIPMAIAVSI